MKSLAANIKKLQYTLQTIHTNIRLKNSIVENKVTVCSYVVRIQNKTLRCKQYNNTKN